MSNGTFQHEFLEVTIKNWPRVSDSDLQGCNAEEVEELREFEQEMINKELAALTDIILNCNNGFQFAKTYKVLWADLRKTLAFPGSSSVPKHKRQALKRMFDCCIRYKLNQMKWWFEFNFAASSDLRQVKAGKFANAIDIYAGKEGIKSSGCATAVLFFITGCLAIITSGIWLA